jgi:hypothetical protein
MTIGTGIAIAGVWIFVGMLGISKTVTSYGLILGILVAGFITYQILN